MENFLPIDLKDFVRIVKNTHYLNSDNIPYEKIKKIIIDADKPVSREEIYLKNFSDAFLYVLQNINTSFNTNLILKTYYILSNSILDTEIAAEIVEEYYLYNDESPHFKALKIHECIMKKIVVSNIEMAIMFSNYIMIQNKRRPLVILPSFYKRYKNIILNDNGTIEEKHFLFIELEVPIKDTKENLKLIDCKEICLELLQMRSDIESYGVEKLYVFGSVAKEENTINSDLDLLVKMRKDVFNFERRIKQVELKAYLEENLKINIDIVEFNYAIATFNIYELENIITVF